MAAFETHYRPDDSTTRLATVELGLPGLRGALARITLDSALYSQGSPRCDAHTDYEEVHTALLEDGLHVIRATFDARPGGADGLDEPWAIYVLDPSYMPTIVYVLRDRCQYSVTVVRYEAPVLGAV